MSGSIVEPRRLERNSECGSTERRVYPDILLLQMYLYVQTHVCISVSVHAYNFVYCTARVIGISVQYHQAYIMYKSESTLSATLLPSLVPFMHPYVIHVTEQ